MVLIASSGTRTPRHQGLHAVERAVDVAPARVDLDEPARQQELVAEPADGGVAVEAIGVDGAVDGRDAVGLTREAALHQRVREPAHRSAEPGVDVAHGGARGECASTGRDAERGAHVDDGARGVGVVAEQPGQRHRGADGAEGAVGMHGQARGRCALDARAHLVAGDEGGEQVASRAVFLLRERPRERDDLDARMPIRVKIALVHVDPRPGRAVEQRRAGGIGRGGRRRSPTLGPAVRRSDGASRTRASRGPACRGRSRRGCRRSRGRRARARRAAARRAAWWRPTRRGGRGSPAPVPPRRSSLASMCSPARIGAYRGG